MINLNELANKLKDWFPELLKNAFAASADNFNKANNIEQPYAVVLPQSSIVETYPTFKNPSADFMVGQDFKIEFYLNIKPLKDKSGGETPFWACLMAEEEITCPLFVNLAAYFLESCERLDFGDFQYFLGDNSLILCYNFKRVYRLASLAEKLDEDAKFTISEFKIDRMLEAHE